MFGEEKNLKDSQKNSVKDTSSIPAPYEAKSFHVGSYTKLDKLITALYMVTDIIDKDEPLRNKLRTLGTEILSDMYKIEQNNTGHTVSFMLNKISEVMSFLGIASAINIISEMNCNILKKEFNELDQSLKESVGNTQTLNSQINLLEFFETPNLEKFQTYPAISHTQKISKGHTNIGVQKGSTLLKALNKMSNKNVSVPYQTGSFGSGFDVLKKQRRESILKVVKTINGGATIKDIKDKASVTLLKTDPLVTCSEKTLQRELISMVKDNVLDRMGEKRWSKYFMKAS